MQFGGKICLVTGATGTLGRAVATAFAAGGARLALLGRSEQALRGAFGGENERRLLVAADVTDAGSVAAAVETVKRRFGTIEILVNAAGGFEMGEPVHALNDTAWERMMSLNARSVIYTARAVVPGMIAAGRGKIVNVAAMAALVGRKEMGAYSASKSAVIRLTESLSAELRDQGINVNCVLPSILDTPQNRAAMPGADPTRWVAPEALAEVILFLASDAARAIHGAAIPVTGLA